MTAAILLAEVTGGTPGVATVLMDGQTRDVPVSLGRTMSVGDIVVLLRDDRRVVCLGRVAS